ncbi:MAG: hypothetical protein Q8P23_02820 [bacterium]|nr:hypothetical protein [bacterium]
MGYLFVYQPALLLLESKQTEATKLFLTTAFAFACITGTMVLSWFFFSTIP